MSQRVSDWLNKKTKGAVEKDSNGVSIISEQTLKFVCLENQGYELPELNENLYLHFRGFRRIENLDKYTGLKVSKVQVLI